MKALYLALGLAIGIGWIAFSGRFLSLDRASAVDQSSPTVVKVVYSQRPASQSDQSVSHGMIDSWFTWLVVFCLIDLIPCVMAKRMLASICRREDVPASHKLKLVENEDVIFDFPLYIGLLGTVGGFCLIAHDFVSSRDAAYISTIIGIIFSAAMRFFILRPVRISLQEKLLKTIGQRNE